MGAPSGLQAEESNARAAPRHQNSFAFDRIGIRILKRCNLILWSRCDHHTKQRSVYVNVSRTHRLSIVIDEDLGLRGYLGELDLAIEAAGLEWSKNRIYVRMAQGYVLTTTYD